MAAPADADKVIEALRLGWYMAEVRGRNRLDPPKPESSDLPSRLDHFLPLRNERKSEERRIEAQVVLSALALRLNVAQDSKGNDFPQEVDGIAKKLDLVRGTSGALAQWETLANKLYYFDAHIQDTLSASSDSQATAYLLGRGVSETYWALDVHATDTATSWTFLLGSERITELSRGVARLSAYFNAYTAPAVAGSLAAWHKVATVSAWRTQSDAPRCLYLQIRRWYGLLVLGQDPSSLIKPYAILRSWRAVVHALSSFAFQLTTLGASLGLIVGLSFLATYGKTSAWVNTLLGLVSALGVTVAAVQARMKNTATAILARLRRDVYTDLVAGDITYLPVQPGKNDKQMRKIAIQASQDRELKADASP